MKAAITLSTACFRKLRDVISEAATASWGDVMPNSSSGLMHVEYQLEEQGTIAFLRLWSSIKRGYWDLVCEYWMHEHPFGPIGLRFSAGRNSACLAQHIDAIMQNQEMFKAVDGRQSRGLIQVFPPDAHASATST